MSKVAPTHINSSSEETVEKSKTLLNRAEIESNVQIKNVDRDEEYNLDLFCYTQCSEHDSPLVKSARGVVFHGDDLVMKAFSYTPEYMDTDTQKIEEFVLGSPSTVYYSHEGSLLRAFYFRDKWFLSTHRKLDAFKSKWSSTLSFGEIFESALSDMYVNYEPFKRRLNDTSPGSSDTVFNRFFNTLDKGKHYMFLLRNTAENRIVCLAPKVPTVYHVGVFVDGELSMEDAIDIPYPEHTIINRPLDLHKELVKINEKYHQGLMVFRNDGTQAKIYTTEYKNLYNVRGNEPSIKFRYLQVRMDQKMCRYMHMLYPHSVKVFEEYENTLYDIAKMLYRTYVQRFIKKNYTTLPQQEFIVVSECHKWHIEDRVNNKITLEKVIQILNKQSAISLNHMIKRYKTEQFQKRDVNVTPTRIFKTPLVDSVSNGRSVSPIRLTEAALSV